MNKKTIIVVIVLLVVLTGVNVFWTFKNFQNNDNSNESDSNVESSEFVTDESNSEETTKDNGIIFETIESTEESSDESMEESTEGESNQATKPNSNITAKEYGRITTQAGRVVIFYVCDDYITPKNYVNLRTEPSTKQGDATVSVQITKDTVVHRVAVSNDTGWSCVEYNGERLYVISSYMSVVEMEIEESSTEESMTSEISSEDISFEETNSEEMSSEETIEDTEETSLTDEMKEPV